IRSPQRILPGRWAQRTLPEASQALRPAPLIHLAEEEDRQAQREEVQTETEQERRKRQGAVPEDLAHAFEHIMPSAGRTRSPGPRPAGVAGHPSTSSSPSQILAVWWRRTASDHCPDIPFLTRRSRNQTG